MSSSVSSAPTALAAPRTVVVYPDRVTLHQAVASRLLLALSDRLAVADRADIALTGGRDGNAILAALPAHPLNPIVDWSRVHLWWGDERFVAADDPDRNARQARDAWFGALVASGLIPESHVHEMPADARPAEEVAAATDAENDAILARAATDYQAEIERELGPDGAFDVAMFGIGPDGHFASLFPDHPEVLVDDPAAKVIGVNHSPKLPPLRVSLTVPFIHACRAVWMIASTPGKSDAVAAALVGAANGGDPHVPSSFAAGRDQSLWLLDAFASAKRG
ncbi:6-phosphogluconolactonase [Bifidobacterium avesanii]|uniref:6-phosphogluconolactonase n=1 Tax=Bifidobacterium avesanii TaxID=1798157 RepID=A0A7K3TKA4_9BIFI|nr:6-phosphogluconolactonase [Bifidobacterium avesanii]KAB8291897.1 6-phosphogluconolactonase [Bifidobacterium avesanii]NEG78683.1 6-phosphogluconolactonase [Bifidobacterium avesanii]